MEPSTILTGGAEVAFNRQLLSGGIVADQIAAAAGTGCHNASIGKAWRADHEVARPGRVVAELEVIVCRQACGDGAGQWR